MKTQFQCADIFTKNLSAPLFRRFKDVLLGYVHYDDMVRNTLAEMDNQSAGKTAVLPSQKEMKEYRNHFVRQRQSNWLRQTIPISAGRDHVAHWCMMACGS